jgi:hypothetical protein
MNDLATLAVSIAATVAAPVRADAGPGGSGEKILSRLELVMDESQKEGGVANLPYARGRTFQSLDEYLAHLERQGAIDLPWWRQIAPGIYERATSLRGRPPERATRAELMRRFGFTR